MPDSHNREDPTITVIVPTLATRERAPYLRRALESIRAQSPVRALSLVIVNGPDFNQDLVDELLQMPDVRVIRQKEASLPAALRTGRENVRTELFSELDDDDCLLKGALARRRDFLSQHPDCEVVVSNGHICVDGSDSPSLPDPGAVQRDPLRALMQRNWLLPGAALFRTSAITRDYFAAIPPYLEWTYLALLLATRARLRFLADLTFRHFDGHSFSVDKSRACILGRAQSLARLLDMDLPGFVKRRTRARIADAHHAACELYLAEGDLRAAWKEHRQSLRYARGIRYLLYTRYLLRAMPGAVVRDKAPPT